MYVFLDADRPPTGHDQGDDHTTDRPTLVELLRDQVEDLRTDRDAWRDQVRRSDYMASTAMDRTRELEGRLRELEPASSSEAAESDESPGPTRTPTEHTEGAQEGVQVPGRKRWWEFWR